MSGGVSGLLKYRFRKREEEKIATSSPLDKKSSDSSAINGQPPRTPDIKASADTVPDTPESQRPSPTSPVFNGVSKTSTSSANVSSRQLNFGGSQIKIIKVIKSPASSTSQTSVTAVTSPSPSPSVSSSVDDREVQANISTLQAVFPLRTKDELKQCLTLTRNDYDEAVNMLMSNKINLHLEGQQKRSCSAMSSPDSTPVRRVYKRARIVSSDEDDDSSAPMGQALSGSQSTLGQFSLDSSQDAVSQSANVDSQNPVSFLQGAFPMLPRQILQDTLKKHDGDTERATLALTEMCSKEISQTDNVGSIKAMKEARVIAHATGQISHQKMALHKSSKKNHIVDDDGGSGDDWRDDDDDDESSSDDELKTNDVGRNTVILKFMNEASLSDLISINGCSKRKADLLLQLRPFDSFDDLLEKLTETDGLTTILVVGCKELLKVRQSIQNLMRRCEGIAKKLEGVINELTSKTSLDITDNDREYISKQPAILNQNMQLTPYQLIGLNWLVIMHELKLNGILGDEMGLGKTIQTIAFLAYMKENNIPGPHLIVAPSSTLDNWLRELKTWCPTLKVLLYYGPQEDRADLRRQIYDSSCGDFDVAVTTYNMATGSIQDRNLFKKFDWAYVVFDEGHMLKNMSSMRYQSLMKINSERRFLLTGTPLQNNLIELMSLLAFVMPDLFNSKTGYLKRIFTSITGKAGDETRSEYEVENVAHAKRILKPFFLRRLKTEVLKQLPKKTEQIHYVPMSTEQQTFYIEFHRQFKEAMKKKNPESDKTGLGMLIQLRKAANHPLLQRRLYDHSKLRLMARDMLKQPSHTDAVEQYVFEDMEVMSDFELNDLCKQYKMMHKYQLDDHEFLNSGKFQFLNELLPPYKEKGARVLLFSQFVIMLDIIEVYVKQKGYKFLRLDGSTAVSERQELIDDFNSDPSIFIFLLSTRAGGLGINLTAANVVVMHDIDYNPYNDKQAEDRCHRLGQKRDVIVHRLLSAKTVEEGMWKCALSKLRLEQDVTGQAAGENMEKSDVASLIREALQMDFEQSKS